MNTLYRLLWNNALRQFVVASEFARPHVHRSKATELGTIVLCTALAGGVLPSPVLHAAPTYVTNTGGNISYYNATSNLTDYIITNESGIAAGGGGGGTVFTGAAYAANAIISNVSGTDHNYNGGYTVIQDTANAGSATITNAGSAYSDARAGLVWLYGTASAANATIINNGATATGGQGGTVAFYQSSTAGNATLIAHDGSGNGGNGGGISFEATSSGGTAKILLDGNGLLDISNYTGTDHTITIGSLATVSGLSGGLVTLGSNTLSVGGDDTSTTFSGKIQGTGDLTKVGTGTLTLSGASTFTGSTTVNNGTLALANANALTSNVTVNNGGTLAVDGVTAGLTGNVTNAGTLRVGVTGSDTTNASAGTLNIGGDYTQTADGLLQIGAWNRSTGGYGKVIVSGTATLADKAKIEVDVKNFTTLTNGQTLAGVLTASSLNLAGNATLSKVADSSWLYDFTATKNGNQLDLNVVSAATNTEPNVVPATTDGSGSSSSGTGGNTVARAVQLSGLQVVAGGVASVLDGMVQNTHISGDAANIVTALGKLSDAPSVAKAAAQTTPYGQTGLSSLRFVTMQTIGQNLQDRLDSQRGLSSGDSISTDGRAWMRLVGSWANQDDKDGVPGYDANTGVLTAGSDALFGRNLRLGVAFSYANSNVDGNTGITGTAQNADINSYLLSMYGTYSLTERTALDFSVDGGFNHNDAERSINFSGLARTASASYNTTVAHAGAGLKQTYSPTKDLILAPFTRVDYTRLRDGSYDESGADALDLHVNSNTVEALVLSAGSQLAYWINEKSSLTAEAGIGYDAINDQPAITSTMTGAQGIAFTTKGADPSPWRLGGGLGLAYKVRKDIVLSGNYDVLYNDTLLNQTVSAKLRWSF